jgi:hypothetical protein
MIHRRTGEAEDFDMVNSRLVAAAVYSLDAAAVY